LPGSTIVSIVPRDTQVAAYINLIKHMVTSETSTFNKLTKTKDHPLHIASKLGNILAVRIMLENNQYVDARNAFVHPPPSLSSSALFLTLNENLTHLGWLQIE
jgi:ankyrin repeat protein